jgi:YfiH family protein
MDPQPQSPGVLRPGGPLPPGVLRPGGPLPPGVQALCTTRAGGVSAPPFDSFNLGDHVHDDPVHVASNRQRLARLTAPARPVFLRQVHGTRVLRLQAGAAHLAASQGREADACLTTDPGVACTIMVADCLPVLFAHASGRAVAAAHAGWRGLASGVLEATVLALRDAAGPGAITAWLGPCIGPGAFEVGEEVRAAFGTADAAQACLVPLAQGVPGQPAKWLANLPALARWRLRQAGVTDLQGNDGSPAWCTVTQSSAFFSHRRDAGRLGSTGRMAACIWFG